MSLQELERLTGAVPTESLLRSVLALVPGAKTERGLIDFEKLSHALGDAVEPERERFTMTWPGKSAAARLAHMPSLGTLRPRRDESVSFDDSEHVIIEGDNLEVLKILQRSYNARVKVIYIDPPYNTGHDFVYEDDFKDPLETYLASTGQTGERGERLSSNPETDGRYHSRWLSMMLPRLALARNLLRQDGAIFISIDDTELANLRKLCDEVFGEENFVGCAARVAKKSSNKGTHFAPSKDYLVVYARDRELLPPFMDTITSEYVDRFDQEDERGKFATVGLYQAALDSRPNQRYWVECPDGSLAIPPGESSPTTQRDAELVLPAERDGVWRWSRDSYLEKRSLLVFKRTKSSPLVTPDGTRSAWNVYTKYYLADRLEDGVRPRDFLEDTTNDAGTRALSVLGLEDAFDFAKPVGLIERLLTWVNTPDALVLDFFAGSGTTAEAVLRLNSTDGGHRRFVLVQLPEPTGRTDFATIADITRERMRRVIARDHLQVGFRAFRLDSSNMRPWDADRAANPEGLAEQLELHVEPILPDRTDDDILFEILERSGMSLAECVDVRSVEGETIHVAGDLVVCLSRHLTLPLLRAIAALKPARVVVLDVGFRGDDALKANAVETMRSQGVLSFKSL